LVEDTQEPADEQTGPGGEDTRPAKKTRAARPVDAPRAGGGMPPILGTALAAAILLLAGGGTFAGGYFTNAAVDDDGGGGGTAAAPTAAATVVAAATPTPPVVVANVSADDDPAWGPADAKVTVVEFSDFQCPYCGRFATQTYSQIKQEYEGKIRFVFRDFPLSTIHPWAEKGAEAAGCANEQGKFWEYHDAIFQNQTAITEKYQTAAQSGDAVAGLAAAVDALKSTATDLGLDATAFAQCLDSGKNAQEIQKDYQDGISYGVQGTPAFYVNGLLVSGAQPFANFKTVIDAALQAGG
jgi:protein-disulfide isomerase